MNTLFVLIIIFFSLFSLLSLSLSSFQISYSIVTPDRQVIYDKNNDNLFIDLPKQESYYNYSFQDNAIDIESVNFFSNGRNLNATLWMGNPIPTNEELLRENVTNFIYGMLIDSDFDQYTGKDGIDYQLEIQWNNQTKSWIKFFGEYSSTNSFRAITEQYNFTNFYDYAFDSLSKNPDHGYVILSLDLDSINLPNRYNIMFYSQKVINNFEFTEFDFTNSISIPSPVFTFTPVKNSDTVRQGETKTISTQLQSNLGSLLKSVEFEPIQNESGIKLIPKSKKLSQPFSILNL